MSSWYKWLCPHSCKDDKYTAQLRLYFCFLLGKKNIWYLSLSSTYTVTAILIWNCTGITFVWVALELEFSLGMWNLGRKKHSDLSVIRVLSSQMKIFSFSLLYELHKMSTWFHAQLWKRCHSTGFETGCRRRPQTSPLQMTRQTCTGHLMEQLDIKSIPSRGSAERRHFISCAFWYCVWCRNGETGHGRKKRSSTSHCIELVNAAT